MTSNTAASPLTLAEADIASQDDALKNYKAFWNQVTERLIASATKIEENTISISSTIECNEPPSDKTITCVTKWIENRFNSNLATDYYVQFSGYKTNAGNFHFKAIVDYEDDNVKSSREQLKGYMKDFKARLPDVVQSIVSEVSAEHVISRLPEKPLPPERLRTLPGPFVTNVSHERKTQGILNATLDLYNKIFNLVAEEYANLEPPQTSKLIHNDEQMLVVHLNLSEDEIVGLGGAVELFNDTIRSASNNRPYQCPAEIHNFKLLRSTAISNATEREHEYETLDSLQPPEGCNVSLIFKNALDIQELYDFLYAHEDAFKESIKRKQLGHGAKSIACH